MNALMDHEFDGRLEDRPLLQGLGQYVANIELPPGALHVGYCCSTEAHARLLSVDASAARLMPGVVDVVVAGDLPFEMSATTNGQMPQPLLADEVVRYVGEPVAAVVARSEVELEDALAAIDVDYERLPPLVDPDGAATSSTWLFPEAGTNVAGTATGGHDTPPPWAECDVVVEATIRNQRVAVCPIEPRVGAAWWDDSGRLVAQISCQGANPIQGIIASLYGLDRRQVRVISRDVGGSFGAKGRPYPEQLLLPFISRRVGRPVRWTPPRSTDMVGLGHGRAQRQDFRIGGNRDGVIRALEVKIRADAGAYPLSAPNLMRNTGNLLPGPYRIGHLRWTAEAVVTNTTPVVAYRGAGRPEAAAIVDRAIDAFAAEIRMDAAEVRLMNLLSADELPWTNPNGITYDSGNYSAALRRALTLADYEELRREQANRRQRGDVVQLGIGISVFVDRTAGIAGKEYGAVELNPDGSITARTGSAPTGQGHQTTWAQLVSVRTGIPIDRITVVHGDTDAVPRGSGTGGSRSTQKGGAAVAVATEQLVDHARHLVGDLLEAAADDIVLDLEHGQFHVAGAPAAATVTWADLAAAIDDRGALHCEADFEPDGATIPYGAYVAVVDVDIETGNPKLQRFICIDDAGTIVNPTLATGQVHGGVAQGIAQALWEEFCYDDSGNPVSSTFMDYLLPSAADLVNFESELMETPTPLSRFGFKGIAESGTVGAPPAVQNAIVDALSHLGIRHLDMPLTPERIWRAIHGERGHMSAVPGHQVSSWSEPDVANSEGSAIDGSGWTANEE